MPNKKWDQLTCIDRKLRRLFPTQMWKNDEIIVTIEMFGGFEFFNTRPYHNYENWSAGYRIKTGDRYGNIVVTAEDLDDALRLLEKELEKFHGRENSNVVGDRYTKRTYRRCVYNE